MIKSQTASDQSKMKLAMPPNAVVSFHASSSANPTITMATVQIPQMRILQSIATKPIQVQHFQHPVQTSAPQLQLQQGQQIQVFKAISAGKGDTLDSSMTSVKTSYASPSKGSSLLTIPTRRMLGSSSVAAKLKVGDTIIIPTKTLSTFNPLSKPGVDPIIIKSEAPGQIIFSTPTKIQTTAARSSATVPQQSGHVRSAITDCPSTPISSSLPSSRLSAISPSSWTPSPMQYKRSNEYCNQDVLPDSLKKSRRTPSGPDKGSKGLRHFAMLVCEKVKQKVTTTYNEVADELVTEYSNAQRHFNDQQYDQKNIRRRVYDALNVLMAMNIIYKDKKDIHWVGLPTNSAQELQALQLEKQKRELRVKQKTAQVHELILQQIAFKNLVQRNKRIQQIQGSPASNSAIQLPFIIVNTSKKTVIDCSISNDKYEYLFNFDNTFEIHDDIEVLKRMGMAYGLEKGTCKTEDLRTAQSLVPPVLRPYLEEMAEQAHESADSFSSSSFNRHSGQSGEDTSNLASRYDGHQLLSSMKSSSDEQGLLMTMEEREDNLGSDRNFAIVERSPRSASSIDSLNVVQVVPLQAAGFDPDCLTPSAFSPSAGDT